MKVPFTGPPSCMVTLTFTRRSLGALPAEERSQWDGKVESRYAAAKGWGAPHGHRQADRRGRDRHRGRATGWSPPAHTHTSSQISDVAANATASPVVLRDGSAGANFANLAANNAWAYFDSHINSMCGRSGRFGSPQREPGEVLRRHLGGNVGQERRDVYSVGQIVWSHRTATRPPMPLPQWRGGSDPAEHRGSCGERPVQVLRRSRYRSAQ